LYIESVSLVFLLPELKDEGRCKVRVLPVAMFLVLFQHIFLVDAVDVGEVESCEQNGNGAVMSTVEDHPRSFISNGCTHIIDGVLQ
jgi:hypothetical protein